MDVQDPDRSIPSVFRRNDEKRCNPIFFEHAERIIDEGVRGDGLGMSGHELGCRVIQAFFDVPPEVAVSNCSHQISAIVDDTDDAEPLGRHLDDRVVHR